MKSLFLHFCTLYIYILYIKLNPGVCVCVCVCVNLHKSTYGLATVNTVLVFVEICGWLTFVDSSVVPILTEVLLIYFVSKNDFQIYFNSFCFKMLLANLPESRKFRIHHISNFFDNIWTRAVTGCQCHKTFLSIMFKVALGFVIGDTF
jgi:hypothetical protein